MALGRTVARVSVRVSPDTTVFARELRAKLAAIRDVVDIKVRPDLDVTRLRAQLAALRDASIDLEAKLDLAKVRAELESIREATVKVVANIDVADVKAKLAGMRGLKVPVTPEFDLAAVQAKLSTLRGLSVSVKVEPELTVFKAKLAAATRRTTAKVKIDADLASFRRRLNAVTRTTTLTVKVVGDFTRLRTGLTTLLRDREVKVKVTLDTAGAMGRFRTMWAQMQAYAIAHPISLRFDVDRNHFGQMLGALLPNGSPEQLRAFTDLLNGVGQQSSQASQGLNGMSNSFGRLTAVLSAVLPIVGAVLQALAYLFAAVAAIKVAAGITQILTDLSGVLGLIPGLALAGAAGLGVLGLGFLGLKAGVGNAKAATDAVKSLKDEFEGLRNAVSDKLFEGMSGPLRDLGTTVIPVLKEGLSGVAGELNRLGLGLLGLVESPQVLDDMAAGLRNTQPLFAGLTDAALNLAEAFEDIAAVGSEFFPGIGSAISGATGNFRDFINTARESGQLKEWIQKGIDTFQQLMRVAGNVKDTITGIFQTTGAESFLDKIEEATAGISAFVNSAEGQKALTDLFNGLDSAVSSVASALADGNLAQTISGIGSALAAMGGAVALAIDGFNLLVDGFQALADFSNSVGDFFSGIGDSFSSIGESAGSAGDALSGFNGSATGIINLLPGIAGGISEAAAGFVSFGEGIAAFGANLNLAGAATTLFQSTVGVALTAAGGVLTTFQVTASATWASVTATTSGASATVSATVSGMAASVSATWSGLRASVTSTASAMRSAVTSTVSSMVAGVRGTVMQLPGIASSAFGGFLAAASTLLGQARSAAASTVSSIIGSFGSLRGALASAGSSAMSGFISGFVGAASHALAVVRSWASKIADAARSALQINSPSKVFIQIGKYTAEGLAVGMLQSRGSVASAAAKMASAAVVDAPPSAAGDQALGAGGVQVTIEGNVGWDPATVAAKIATAQRDALVMAGLAGVAV